MNFMDSLQNQWVQKRTLLCVGLDPDLKKIPARFLSAPKPILAFNKAIVDVTKDFVCTYKPQMAYYSAQGAESDLLETIQYIQSLQIPVILDSKRGDIGETAEMYAREAFERYQADAVTVNPYMGGETLEPYLKYQQKGVFILCKTSNPGSGDFQDLSLSSGNALYEIVASKAANDWNQHGNAMLVVGGTHLESLQKIRSIVGDMCFLVPGVGAQGGDLEKILKLGLNAKRQGLVINSSRGIIYANHKPSWEESVMDATLSTVEIMRKYL